MKTNSRSDYAGVLAKAMQLPLGYEPFHWQQTLLDAFLHAKIPAALDIPTGLGKTSVMAIWLVARLSQPELPRRLVYIVDRRVVVDQATDEAEKLRAFVESDPQIKQALGLSRPLPISTLRGQHLDNKEWLNDPTAPAIIIGTVDMIGSRLLFEGYGVSRKMRPYHAGLLGSDSLIVVDEAHLVPPFEALLESIPKFQKFSNLVPCMQILSLSATGRVRSNTHRLSEEDIEKGSLSHKRIHAKKALHFESHSSDDTFAVWMADKAWDMSGTTEAPSRILVFCNKRKDAEAVSHALRERQKEANEDIALELLVGSRRVRERQAAAKKLADSGWFVGCAERPNVRTFLVATSAGEVGVDLDADHLACDLVAWERMIQRLGRVNRRGDGNAKILVLLPDESPNDKEQKALDKPEASQTSSEKKLVDKYKERTMETKTLRRPFGFLPSTENGIDVSSAAFRNLKLLSENQENISNEQKRFAEETRQAISAASTQPPLRPALSLPLIEAWSMTTLKEHTGRPDIQPWLRGWEERVRPQSRVAWRRFLPLSTDGSLLSPKDIAAYFEAAPVHPSEVLETETDHIFGWLEKQAKLHAKLPSEKQPFKPDSVIGFLLDRSGEVSGTEHSTVRFGDLDSNSDKHARNALKERIALKTLVIDARFGGLGEDGLLKDSVPHKSPATADATEDWLPSPDGDTIIGFRIARSKFNEAGWGLRLQVGLNESEETGATEWLFIYKKLDAEAGEDGRSVTFNQKLVDHQNLAEQCMISMVSTLRFPDEIGRALCFAAKVHDEGKNCPRWQEAFNAPRDGSPYAKTKGPISQKRLDGYRHELLSMLRSRNEGAFKTFKPETQDLILHLIVAHHGFARPYIPTHACDGIPPSKLQKEACEIALRFARLQKQWGPWGLAWLESLLRAADQQASKDPNLAAVINDTFSHE
ncbi:MAG: type I-U CRISPR-associated helicase/endonuclease Cas3 [Opitutales bacterium]